jgi:hypothetical protein
MAEILSGRIQRQSLQYLWSFSGTWLVEDRVPSLRKAAIIRLRVHQRLP